MVLLRYQEAPFEFEFIKKTKAKRMVALTLLMLFGLSVGCGISFMAIGLISAGIGMLNSMGVFGDGQLSEILGYVSIVGSVVGFAGNMMWPGGGIGSGYGADGFGIGAPTESYATAAGLDAAAGANTESGNAAAGANSQHQADAVSGGPGGGSGAGASGAGASDMPFEDAQMSAVVEEPTYGWQANEQLSTQNAQWDNGGPLYTARNPDGSLYAQGYIDGKPTEMLASPSGNTYFNQYGRTGGSEISAPGR